MSTGSSDLMWWKKGIIYHIYPLSFMDSNGDGKGDLPGIISRLDYLQWLGVDAVWISPIYSSPMVDFGYDVSDYTSIHPWFGTMDDFERLLSEAHARGLKIILDFVPNHTSDQHPWFKESRSSRNNPKRDWYLWHDPAPDGGPPNNWLGSFGGSAWEFDPASDQYYYHAFLKEQPDLNWRNPEVRFAMMDVMRFWLDKGVDGFRVDVMWHLIKDKHLRDDPPNPEYCEGMPSYHRHFPAFSADQPEVHGVVSQMRSVTNSYRERMLIGEIYLPISEVIEYYGAEGKGAHLPANFMLIMEPWNAAYLFAGISRYEGSLPLYAWPNWVLSNHDKPRVSSRIGPSQARTAALLLLTLRGTPTIYYGDEIGMQNAAISRGNMYDPAEQQRDPQRTPMQWSAGPNAGFTEGTPWVKINDDYQHVTVEAERADSRSILSLYRKLISLRREEPALYGGRYRPVCLDGSMFAYLREDEQTGRRFLIAINLGHNSGILSVPNHIRFEGEVVISTEPEREGRSIGREINLMGSEGIVALVQD